MKRPKLAREAAAFIDIFRETPNNSFEHRVTLIAVLSVWIVLELGTTFTAASPPVSMGWIRAVAAAVIFREHGRMRERRDALEGEAGRHKNEGGGKER